jgi:hypothetical protein
MGAWLHGCMAAWLPWALGWPGHGWHNTLHGAIVQAAAAVFTSSIDNPSKQAVSISSY